MFRAGTSTIDESTQGSGSLEHGMLPRLIEDYETSGAVDPGRELDIKSVAAVTYAGMLRSFKWS